MYLHQKIQVYVQAYQISMYHRCLTELIDKKDYLVYNFSKEISLAKVNKWADGNKFVCADTKKMTFLDLNEQKAPIIKNNKWVFVFDGFLGAPTASAAALAEDKQ